MKAIERSKCFKCEYHRKIEAGMNFIFIGCTYPPYRGKWIAELTECPKIKKERENND